MKILAKYIHGSHDSTDIDVHYVVEEQPSFQEAKAFCDEDKTENRNVITIRNGIVTDCYKGTPDEINNALIDTYDHHKQEFPLLIEYRVKRDKQLKYIRATRVILSFLSRSQYRPAVKQALVTSWTGRLNILASLQLTDIDFTTLNKNLKEVDILKVIAFQIGQTVGLLDGFELYTKMDISAVYEELKPYLYRETTDVTVLNDKLHEMVERIKDGYIVEEYKIDDEHYVCFPNGGNKSYNLKTEKLIIE